MKGTSLNVPLCVLAKILKKRGVKELVCHAPNCNEVIHAEDWVVSTGYDGNPEVLAEKML